MRIPLGLRVLNGGVLPRRIGVVSCRREVSQWRSSRVGVHSRLRQASIGDPGPSTILHRSSLAQRLTRNIRHLHCSTRQASISASAGIYPQLEPHDSNADAFVDIGEIPRSLPIWLFGCSGLVFAIIIIGGLTRLTESGLSITEWNPVTGILPPLSEKEWDDEWKKYRASPEGIMMNANIERSEFKNIFYMEWAHRIAGRALGLAFIAPAIYYTTRYRLPRLLPTKLLGLGLGIGAQGVLGWFMVKSGLDEQIIQDRAVPRVSQYRLAAHLSAALALYVGMVTTAIGLRRDARASASIRHGGPAAFDGILRALKSPSVSGYKGLTVAAGTMVFLTAVSGAFVAGLDAGLVYNEFPTMGGRLVPPAYELLDKRYAKRADKGDTWWRNVFENPVTAQFDHRLFATTTFTVLLSLPIIARLRRVPLVTRRLADLTAVAAVTQVTLGITTLLYLVPIPIAASHQAGSVVLLTCLMALWGSMRRPSRAVMELRRRMVPATRYT